MARTAIPILTSLANSATKLSLHAGIELNAFASLGAADGLGYYLTNPSGRTHLILILDTPSRSKGKLTIPTNPTATDTFTIDAKVFTIRALADWNVDGEVLLGATVAESRANIVAAIMGTDGVNTAHPSVTAEAFNGSNYTILTAIVPGADGDAIVTTETFTAGGNVFDGVTLGTLSAGGLDSSATISTLAITDPYGRGGVGHVPTYHLLHTITAGGVGTCIYDLGTFTPELYNQTDGTTSVNVTALVGSGKLIGLNI